MNRDLESALHYHGRTKHSYQSLRANPHYLDWSNRPLPFKIYTTLEPISLPRDLPPSQVSALQAIATSDAAPDGECVPNLTTLAHLLYFSAGITKRKMYDRGQILFRAASCTGALYHIDLYLICGDLPGLEAGVYHFGVHDFALRRLRQGDFRGELVCATSGEPAIAAAPVVIACASSYWRNAWKYQARTYRHCFWDNGTILANLLAVSAAQDIPARLVVGFVDAMLSRLLGLDDEREGALSLVTLGHTSSPPPRPPAEIEPLTLETAPLSPREVDYPAIRVMHGASSLRSEEEVTAWRGPTPPSSLPDSSGRVFALASPEQDEPLSDSIEQVVLRRGSTREFAVQPITFAQLSTILRTATRGVPADFLDPVGATLNELYLIVHAVGGLPRGAYVFHRDREALELLKEGEFRSEAGYLGLEQALPAAASVDVFLLADLKPILERFGSRGYRASQLEAGIIGGKLYLAAYAQRLGASGLTFYDDAVTEFFSPHAKGKSVMFLVALGKSARRKHNVS